MYNFTLIIPSYNRHNYLKRSIEYFRTLNAQVIYCDSSNSKYSGNISGNEVYLHLPGKNFAEKILITLDYVATDYVAMCADDDFIVRDSLYKGVYFLEENKDFSTVLGKHVGFYDKFDGNFYKTYQSLPSDINSNARENVKLFFTNYYLILWAMYDKKILVKSFQIIEKANFNNDNFIELVIGTVACYAGGIKFLNNIWSVREISSKKHWANRHKSINNIFFDNKIKKDFQIFKLYIDNIYFQGYADLVMESYLNISIIQKYKALLKYVLKRVLPTKLLLQVRNLKSREIYRNAYKKYPNLKVMELTNDDKYRLKEVKLILEKDDVQ